MSTTTAITQTTTMTPTTAPSSLSNSVKRERQANFDMSNSTSKQRNDNKNAHVKPTSSMTLAISHDIAKLMLEASRAFNNALHRLQTQEEQQTNATKAKMKLEENASSSELGTDAASIKKEQEKDVETDDGTDGAIVAMDESVSSKTSDTSAKSPMGEDASSTVGTELKSGNDQQQPLNGESSADPETHNASSTAQQQQPQETVADESGTSAYKFLLPAALSSQNGLLTSYVSQMQIDQSHGLCTTAEIETCLLLFLDMDKSNKLLAAFELLSQKQPLVKNQGEKNVANDGGTSSNADSDIVMGSLSPSPTKDMMTEIKEEQKNENAKSPPSSSSKVEDSSSDMQLPDLDQKSVMTLFKCFLSSISTCIHHNDSSRNINNSEQQSNKARKSDRSESPTSAISRKAALETPSMNPADAKSLSDLKDWALSSETKNEVKEIAEYATNQVVEYVLKNSSSSDEGKEEKKDCSNDNIAIPFQVFGEWYNAGGFSLVPWLELLDLAKWDYAGRAAAASAAASAAKQKHAVKSSRQHTVRQQSDVPMSMDPIMENDSSDMAIAPATAFPPPPSSYPPAREDRRGGSMIQKQQQQQNSPTPKNIANLFFNSPRNDQPHPKSPRTLISFDFGGTSNEIKITNENLNMVQNIVQKTSIHKRTAEQVTNVLLRHSKRRRIPVSSSNRGQPRLEEVMMVLNRQDFGRCIRDLVPPEASKKFSQSEMEIFSNCFTNFFLCFGRINSKSSIGLDVENVNAKELAVGFSFLCAGNKSAKLATIFETIEDQNSGFLSQRKLMRYLRSYLTMLIGISLLSPSIQSTTETRKALLDVDQSDRFYNNLFHTVENGARWTLDNFLRSHEEKMKKRNERDRNSGLISFEDFASWYTEGGYNIAPWLEFLDLKKFLSLLTDDISSKPPTKKKQGSTSNRIRSFDEVFAVSSPTPQRKPSRSIHSPYPPAPSADVLFTFPLANHRDLVVLREDASYVHTVVKQLGLLSKTPEDVWNGLSSHVKDNPPSPLHWRYAKHHKSGAGKSADVDQSTFVSALEKVVPMIKSRKRHTSSSSSAKDTLNNFFQSFDLNQVDRVAANQLMGGLTLLCGGKKSSKLSFSFGLFDERDTKKNEKESQSLCGKELFYFLRSFLIVMFSCCKQSLTLSADAVGRYISDTANMVTDDVMKYQWKVRRKQRIDFDQFGEWYNEGGFETAPWLELLDLNKWVLLDQAKPKANAAPKEKKGKNNAKRQQLKDTNRPNAQEKEKEKEKKKKNNNKKNSVEESPAKAEPEIKEALFVDCPPDSMLDSGDMFFDDMDGIEGMEGIEDMDFLFNDSVTTGDKENIDKIITADGDGLEANMDFGSPTPYQEPEVPPPEEVKPFKFHLITSDNQSGYVVTISSRRLSLLKSLVMESDLFNVNIGEACERIFSEAVEGKLKKENFDAAMRKVLSNGVSKMSSDTQKLLSDLLSAVFSAFDLKRSGEVDARELACGFIVLCGGRKSDKLEYAYEILDRNKSGLYSRADMISYLQSFLTVLLSMSSCAIGREPSQDILGSLNGNSSTPSRVISWGASWATEQVFKSTPVDHKVIQGDTELINFDCFAEWYTKGGYSSISWLELLDLRKWILVDMP